MDPTGSSNPVKSSSPPPKRKAPAEGDASSSAPKKTKTSAAAKDARAAAEKRLRRWRPAAPMGWLPTFERAATQRFYVLARQRCGTQDCPAEKLEMTGSTGNIYTVRIDRISQCDCPMGVKGKQCKHVAWVLSRVLRAPYEYVYQNALLASELRRIFSQQAAPTERRRKDVSDQGDCPICYCALEEGEDDDDKKQEAKKKDEDKLIWCRAACGQNFHAACFETWATTMNKQGKGKATCPICRSEWQRGPDIVSRMNKAMGKVGDDGYVNVADQLGISTVRDERSYSPWHRYRR